MRPRVERLLRTRIPEDLTAALLDAHVELKDHFLCARFRPSELEAGRFCEVAIRCVQHLGNQSHVPLSAKLPAYDRLVRALENADGGQAHESLRLHIPRALLAVYGVRNRRNVGHVGGDVCPNLADATLVMTVCDWVLAELIRLTAGTSLDEAQKLVDELMIRQVPWIQEFGDFLKVVNPDLAVEDRILALLYHRGLDGAPCGELKRWLPRVPRSTLTGCLSRLEHVKLYVHRAGDICYITRPGTDHIESIMRRSRD